MAFMKNTYFLHIFLDRDTTKMGFLGFKTKGSKVRKVRIATYKTRQELTNIQTRLLLTSVSSLVSKSQKTDQRTTLISSYLSTVNHYKVQVFSLIL